MTKDTIRGILFMLLFCFSASVMTVIVKHIGPDLNVLLIVFIRNLFSFLYLIPFAAFKKRIHIPQQKLPLHMLRAFLGTLHISLFFYALMFIPLTDATAIGFTGPLFTVLVAVFFFHESIGMHRVLGLIIGFIGALIVLRPGMENFHYASLIVLCSVVVWALLNAVIKIIGRTESTTTQLFIHTFLMTCFSLPLALINWTIPSLEQLAWCALLGLLFDLNIISISNAYKRAELTILMPFNFSTLVFTSIFAYVIFQEILDFWTAFGSIIIIASSVYIAHRETQQHKKNNSSNTIHEESSVIRQPNSSP